MLGREGISFRVRLGSNRGPLRLRAIAAASLLVAVSLAAQAQGRPSQPEPPSGWAPKRLATAKNYMVAAAHPLAVEAGLAMLARGGSAVDAMVATQLVLNQVEPTSSGLGGGAYLMYYDARAKKVHAIDGRETAPAGATPALFVGPDGKALPFQRARIGGRSVGVPGTPRLLEVAHARFGKLPWKALFEPAIRIAEEGFALSARPASLMAGDKGFGDDPVVRALYFQQDGTIKPPGSVIRNPEFARTLRALAAGGADAFYRGDIARDVVAAVRGHANPGTMTLEDLAGYRVRDVEALCGMYRRWKLCGMPPSSSGGIAVLQIMGTLERFDMAAVRPGSAQAVHLFSEAGRLAFADRGKYVGDDRFVDVPVRGLVDKEYLAQRAGLIRADRSMGTAKAGVPRGVNVAYAEDPHDEAMGTSHISIVDAAGNAVAMSTTIEARNGSRVVVRGFLLNNQLTDFSFAPLEGERLAANSVAPGKRPRSSMAPFIVLDGRGALEMALGSPGGSLIVNYVAKVLVATLDWGMDVQRAIDQPNFGSRNGPTEVEKGTALESVRASLQAMGHDVRAIDMTSGVQAIRRAPGGWQGGADPRREGVARGR